VHLEISVLGPLQEFPASSYQDVVARLPRAGAVVQADGRRGTYLPAVWDQLPTPEAFVAGLWQKAGLRPGTWPAQVWTYEVEDFGRNVRCD
jgi:AMMECR1 domain-containing protein